MSPKPPTYSDLKINIVLAYVVTERKVVLGLVRLDREKDRPLQRKQQQYKAGGYMPADMFRGSCCDKSELPGAWVEFTASYPTTIPEVTCLHHGVKRTPTCGP